MYVVICRISSKIFFCGRSAGGGSASPSTPPTGRSNRPCTRVSARRRGQEERQKNAAVLSDRIIRLLRSVKVIRSGIPPPTGEHILTLPLTALCNCNSNLEFFSKEPKKCCLLSETFFLEIFLILHIRLEELNY